jgi:hypothetical protein
MKLRGRNLRLGKPKARTLARRADLVNLNEYGAQLGRSSYFWSKKFMRRVGNVVTNYSWSEKELIDLSMVNLEW